jgi:hypothetical protein
MTAPEKRPAFELPTPPAAPFPAAPLKRPIATTAGAGLVLLRVGAGVVWMLGIAFGWQSWVSSFASQISGDSVDAADLSSASVGLGLAAFLLAGSLALLVEAIFGLLILRGRNFPRMVVMVFSVLSISTAFAGWWVQGQDIRLTTTLVTLALDILVLLALSSRSAAAYARRHDRR